MLTWIADKLWGNHEGWRIKMHDASLYGDKKLKYTIAAPGERIPAPREYSYSEGKEKNYYDSLEEAATHVPGTVFPLELRAADDAGWRPGKWSLTVKDDYASGSYSVFAHYAAEGDLNQVILHSPADLSLEEAKAWGERVFATLQESRDWDVQRVGHKKEI